MRQERAEQQMHTHVSSWMESTTKYRQMQVHKIGWRIEMMNQATIADANAQDQLESRDDEPAT